MCPGCSVGSPSTLPVLSLLEPCAGTGKRVPVRHSPRGRSLTGGAAGGGDRVVVGRPRNFPVVALGVSEVGVTAVEELGGDRVLRDACAGRASPFGQLVHVFGPVDSDDD